MSRVKLLDLLDKESASIIWYSYNNQFLKYYGDKYKFLKEDLISNAYVCLLECKRDNLDIHQTFKKIFNSFQNYIRSYNNKNLSLNMKLNDNSKNVLSDIIEDNNFVKVDSDIDIIKKCFYNCLNLYSGKDKKIIDLYILKECSYSDIIKELNLILSCGAKQYIVNIVRDFRAKLCDKLKEYKINVDNYLKDDEFSSYIRNKVSRQKKAELKRQNINVYYNDLFIYSLMRKNYLKEYCVLLNISEDKLKGIIFNKGCKYGNIFLCDIQKLRKKYFNNYSLENLCKVENERKEAF